MYSVPGIILGFMINFVCRNAAIVALYYFADYGTPIDLQNRTIILVSAEPLTDYRDSR